MTGHARLFRELLEVRSCEAMPRSTELKKRKGGKTAGKTTAAHTQVQSVSVMFGMFCRQWFYSTFQQRDITTAYYRDIPR